MRPETAVVLVVAGVCKEVALYLQEVTDYFPFSAAVPLSRLSLSGLPGLQS